MKAVILAAGMGTRLGELTKDTPKSLLEINGRTLLERSLRNISANGIKEVIIVVGFMGDKIQEKIGNQFEGMNITYVQSKKYDSTGSMHSLYQIKDELSANEGIIVLESDLLYEKKAIKTLIESSKKDAILVGPLLNSGDDVFICSNEKGHITNLGKKISLEEQQNATGALVGISKYSSDFLSLLFNKAESHFENGEDNYHYEEAVMKASNEENPIHAVSDLDLHWTEIDNEEDLERARTVVHANIQINDGTD